MFGRGMKRLCWAPRRLCLWMVFTLVNLSDRYSCTRLLAVLNIRDFKDILCLVPVNRHLILRTFKMLKLLRSWVRDENSFSGSLEANVRLVSSAYILTSDKRLQFGRSLMYYSRNSRGPRIEPWGTPQRMRLVSDFINY